MGSMGGTQGSGTDRWVGTDGGGETCLLFDVLSCHNWKFLFHNQMLNVGSETSDVLT